MIGECDPVENVVLQQKGSDLKIKLQECQKKTSDQADMNADLVNKINMCVNWCNRNEQYSRRNNIKILGVERDTNEAVLPCVVDLIITELRINVKAEDIEAAHILPKAPGQDPERPSTLLSDSTSVISEMKFCSEGNS